jgi:histidinol phosphatase-like PHP family hydrolase
MIINSDYHIHTRRSLCAQEDAEVISIIREMKRLQFESIGFSDHYYVDQPMKQWIEEIKDEIVQANSSMKISIGIEVDMMSPGNLLASKEQLQGYDYIMVACPHYQNKKISMPIASDYNSIAQSAFDYMISAAGIPYVDIIVHPFDARGIKHIVSDFSLPEMMNRFSEEEYRQIIELLLKNNIAVELTERLRQDDYFEALCPFLSLCRQHGVSFSFGSDAHAMNHLASVRRAAQNIQSLGIEDDNIKRL